MNKRIITFFSFLLLSTQINGHRDTIIAGIGATTIISATGILYQNYQNESKTNPLIKKAGFIPYLKNQWKIIHSKQGLSHFSLVIGLTLIGEVLIAGATIDAAIQYKKNINFDTQNPKLIDINPKPIIKNSEPDQKPKPDAVDNTVIEHPEYASLWTSYETWKDSQPKTKRNARLNGFIADCKKLEHKNKTIAQHPHDDSIVRIANYNVHFWQDPFGQGNKKNIFKIIKTLDADILVLEEVCEENEASLNQCKKELAALGYQYEYFTNTYTLNKSRLFGNWILSRKPFSADPQETCFKIQATAYDRNQVRSFIKTEITLANNKTLSIYGTHLDVYDTTEKVRKEQIIELITATEKDNSDYIVVAGDLNSIRQKDYESVPGLWEQITTDNKTREEETPQLVSDALDDAGFTDCFTATQKPVPGFTVWAGTTVDFLLLKNAKDIPIKNSAVYFDASSDHLPILMDIDITK
jgi:endonuclease/exonuclease/phosphatase family metal-dependent hydrolase